MIVISPPGPREPAGPWPPPASSAPSLLPRRRRPTRRSSSRPERTRASACSTYRTRSAPSRRRASKSSSSPGASGSRQVPFILSGDFHFAMGSGGACMTTHDKEPDKVGMFAAGAGYKGYDGVVAARRHRGSRSPQGQEGGTRPRHRNAKSSSPRSSREGGTTALTSTRSFPSRRPRWWPRSSAATSTPTRRGSPGSRAGSRRSRAPTPC